MLRGRSSGLGCYSEMPARCVALRRSLCIETKSVGGGYLRCESVEELLDLSRLSEAIINVKTCHHKTCFERSILRFRFRWVNRDESMDVKISTA